MADSTRLYFLDMGLTNNKDGVLQGRIMTCNSRGEELKCLVDGLKAMPDGVQAYKNQLYYTCMGSPKQNTGALYRVDMDGTNNQVIVPEGQTFTPKQLHLVPEHGKIYWCDREGMRVMRCSLDGSDLETLIQTGPAGDRGSKADPRLWCVGVGVDAKRKKFYWTQKGASKGNEGRLFSANTDFSKGQDASTRTDITLLLDSLPEPIDLDIDEDQNVLYLTDRGDPPLGNSISRIHLSEDGKVDERKILVRKLHEAIGLALDLKNKRMFFTDLNGSLYSSDMDGGNEVELFKAIGDLTGVACVSN